MKALQLCNLQKVQRKLSDLGSMRDTVQVVSLCLCFPYLLQAQESQKGPMICEKVLLLFVSLLEAALSFFFASVS